MRTGPSPVFRTWAPKATTTGLPFRRAAWIAAATFRSDSAARIFGRPFQKSAKEPLVDGGAAKSSVFTLNDRVAIG